jgi:hypothetical protein
MKLKSNYPFTNVPVVVHDDLGLTPWGRDKEGGYSKGFIWPFSMIPGFAGKIKMEPDSVTIKWMLMHELQHANDFISPSRMWKKFFMRDGEWEYYLELRGEVMGTVYKPLHRRKEDIEWSVTRLKLIREGLTKDEIRESLYRQANEFGFNLDTHHRI